MTPIIDLHLDTFIWTRLFGYDLSVRHDHHFAQGIFLGQVDLPRLKDAGFTGAMWSITTQPFRSAHGRAHAFAKNFKSINEVCERHSAEIKIITHTRDLQKNDISQALPGSESTRLKHSFWLSVQGGNAFSHDVTALDEYAPKLSAVTLMHLTHSDIGTSSLPYPSLKKRGLTELGRKLIACLNLNRIFVDLAHADGATFWDAVKTHDSTQPLMVSHTGVKGVHPHWRNIDDAQIKAVANTGGVMGVLYHSAYLGSHAKKDGPEAVVLHLEHIQKVAGDDFTALGSDWDGFILPPNGLRDCAELPKLIRAMEKRGWSTSQIEKTLGQNFLRAFAQLRPGP